jgi:hypothetical protein
MAVLSRKRGSTKKGKSDSRVTGRMEVAEAAVELLIESGLLLLDARSGAARALEVIIKGIQIAQREARSVRVEIIFTSRGKIMVSSLGRPTVTATKRSTPTRTTKLRSPLRRSGARQSSGRS